MPLTAFDISALKPKPSIIGTEPSAGLSRLIVAKLLSANEEVCYVLLSAFV